MNHPRLTTFAFLLLGTTSLTTHSSAQLLTITEWAFDNNAVAVNTSPAPSTGTGTASTLGFISSYNSQATPTPTNSTSVDTSDINTSTPTSNDPAGIQQWRIRGGDGTTAGNTATGNNGWSSFAPIASQGAQFVASTAGLTNIHVSFDWSPTAQGEANLQVMYTLNGSTYINVPATAFTLPSTVTAMTNTTSANTVMGGYIQTLNSTTYNNGISVDLSGIAGAANNPKFGVELVNASTGADDISTKNAALNNTSGNWRFDAVTISGTAIAVPEPSTFVMAGLGLGGLLALVRRRKAV